MKTNSPCILLTLVSLQLVSRPSVPAGNNKTAGAATTSVPGEAGVRAEMMLTCDITGKRNAGRGSHVLNSNGHTKVKNYLNTLVYANHPLILLDCDSWSLHKAFVFKVLQFQDHENNGEVAPPAPASGPASTKHRPIEKSETVSKATGANTAQGVSKSE